MKKTLSDHFGGASVTLDAPISVRDNSEIFHARIDTVQPLELAVKHCLVTHTTTPDESAAKVQFGALERVNGALANRDNRYCVPTPLCLAPELATYAMSWIEGRSLTKLLHRPTVFIEGTRWFEDVGAWMGHFHQSGPLRRRQVNLDERLAVIDQIGSSPLPDKSFANATLILKKTASALEGIEVNATWLHGDCKTDNFILGEKIIYGIDISLNYENPVEYDLAQFLNNLDLLLSNPQYLHLAGMKTRLENAFWQGYQSTGPAVSQKYLDWLRLNFLVAFWHSMLNEQKRTLRTWILNRMFKKLVNRLSRRLS